MSAGVTLAAGVDSKGLVALAIPLGLIGDSFLVKPLDDVVDHTAAWVTAMGVDLVITAILFKAVYHGHQVN